MANVIWQPNPGPQTRYLASQAFEVLFGGARGGGKSEAGVMDPLRDVGHPLFRGIAFRETYPELEQLIERTHRYYKRAFPRAYWHGTQRTWLFPSGASIKFRHLQQANAWRKYLGHEYHWILFEELTSFAEQKYMGILGSCRSSVPGLRPRMRATTNPGGPGHGWVRARFIDSAPAGTIYTDPRTGLTRQFIPSRVTDTPQIMRNDPLYIKRLELLPEADRKAMLDGDWDAYQGQVLQLKPGVHRLTWAEWREVTGLQAIPAEWTRFTALDWGYAHPFCVGWYAVDYKGRLYKYREWYGAKWAGGQLVPDVGAGLLPAQVAEHMLKLEDEAGEVITDRIADPSIKGKPRGDMAQGPTIQEQFADAGVIWRLGDNDREAGLLQMQKRLYVEEDGYPGLIFIEEECRHGSIRTIPALEYDPAKGGEDVNTKQEDHAYDETRYAVMSRPYEPRLPDDRNPFLLHRAQNEDWRVA